MGNKVHTIRFTKSLDGSVSVRRFHIDLYTMTDETIYDHEYAPGELDIDAAFAWCENHGYVRIFEDLMSTYYVHNTLPDRVDMAQLSDGTVRVTLIDRRGIPQESFIVARGLRDCEDLLQDHGYHTFFWNYGARAFRGDPWPVRSRSEIWHKRRKLEEIARHKFRQNAGKWHPEETLLSMDLAYAG